MKLLNYMEDHQVKLGIKTERGIVAVAAAVERYRADAAPLSVHAAIEGGAAAVDELQQLASRVLQDASASNLLLDEEQLAWAPSVTQPGKIICVGLNYRKHAEETNAPIPAYPVLFNKFSNTLTGHLHDVALPRASKEVDYEAELVIVIGKPAKYVAKEQALDYVFGYSAVNDLSARDLQLRTPQWMLGKICDGFSPLGPYLVTADEVGDANDLEIKCMVNGEVRQHSSTSDMIFRIDEIVSYLSQHLTLSPGDIILTGTPEGVVLGYPADKRVYLQDGDVVTVEIEKLGAITNKMVAEV